MSDVGDKRSFTQTLISEITRSLITLTVVIGAVYLAGVGVIAGSAVTTILGMALGIYGGAAVVKAVNGATKPPPA